MPTSSSSAPTAARTLDTAATEELSFTVEAATPAASLQSPPNQRRIWRQLVRVVIACLSISPVRRRGRGLRSVHGELRRAYRAFITCWQTETGLLLPTGMLPAPYGLALPQSAHFVAVAISADIAVVSSR